MTLPTKKSNYTQEEKLLWQIIKELNQLRQQMAALVSALPTTTTTTTSTQLS